MYTFKQTIKQRCLQCIPVLLLLMVNAQAATPPETVLSNTVQASYAVGKSRISKQDSVSLTTSKRTPARISLHTPFPDGEVLAVQPAEYQDSTSNWRTSPATTAGDIALAQTDLLSVGEDMVIRVEDFDQNLDPTQRETIVIQLASLNEEQVQDEEVLRLTETAPSSGVFVASLPIASAEQGRADGVLSVTSDSRISAQYQDKEDQSDLRFALGLLDAYGLVFDSRTGEPINGARIRLVRAGSGRPAEIFDSVGNTWPSEVVSGAAAQEPAVASKGYTAYPGSFRFPRIPAGDYRLEVTAPPGYRFPSQQSDAQLQALGEVAEPLSTGSRGNIFTIENELGTLNFNVPLDRFDGRFSLEKTSHVPVVSQGEALRYKVIVRNHDEQYPLQEVVLRDTLPPGFRYQAGSAQLVATQETLPAEQVRVNGRVLAFELGELAPDSKLELAYWVTVRAGAPRGEAINRIVGLSKDAQANEAQARVTVKDELMRYHGLLTGQVFTGVCGAKAEREGVQQVRLYLDNGRSVVTDAQGYWHLEGLKAGTHALQVDRSSLPAGARLEPCEAHIEQRERPHSRLLNVAAGELRRVDFRIVRDATQQAADVATALHPPVPRLPDNPLEPFDEAYLEDAEAGFQIVWPPDGHVPPISSLGIVVQHPSQQQVKVLLNGEPVPALNAAGNIKNKQRRLSLSRWKGVDIEQKNNTITAILLDKNGQEQARLNHHVHFTEKLVKAELVPEESVLVADGQHAPLIAVRLSDAAGYTPRPRTRVQFSLESSQWQVAKPRQLGERTRLDFESSDSGQYEYTVSDDGLVRIQLEPTSRSGRVRLNMHLGENRYAPVSAWLQPVLRDWIVVGFVEGGAAYQALSGNMQTLQDLGQEAGWDVDGQTRFFAKGRIKGKYLLTLAYDSDKQDAEVGAQLDGVLDSEAWYTLYGDEQVSQYEAPSASELFIKLEREQFYALFGDYHTDLEQTELGRYQRVLHGLHSQYAGSQWQYNVFASQSRRQHQRDEIPGDGTSGLYYLSRDIVPNSERIVLETRDRDDPATVLQRRSLTRFNDYEVDYEAGTVFFKFPVSSRDDDLNPIVIVIDYESDDDAGERQLSAGGRVAYTTQDKRLQTGVTVLHESEKGDLVALDTEFRPNEHWEAKAEIAQSRSDDGDAAQAWQAELNYRRAGVQGQLYAREQDDDFGLVQQSEASKASRKLGAEARYQLSDNSHVDVSASQQSVLGSEQQNTQADVQWTQQFEQGDLGIGLRHRHEQSASVDREVQQVIAQGNRSFNDGRSNIGLRVEKAVGERGDSVQSADQLRLSVDHKLTPKTSLYAEQAWLKSASQDGSETRLGLRATPWEGGRLQSGYVQAQDSEQSRDYVTLGIGQRWQLNEHLSVDLSFDQARTLDFAKAVPNRSENDDSAQRDDFWALSLEAGWTDEQWRVSGLAEWRESERETRYNLRAAAVRDLDERRSVAASLNWYDSETDSGVQESDLEMALHFALRPQRAHEATWFNRLSLENSDTQQASEQDKQLKLINNLHYQQPLNESTALSVHHGIKWLESETAERAHDSVTDTLQLGVRRQLSERWDAGVRGGYLRSWESGNTEYYGGLSLGFAPQEAMRVEFGYNFAGFDDRDFGDSQYSYEGPYFGLKYQLDQSLLDGLD